MYFAGRCVTCDSSAQLKKKAQQDSWAFFLGDILVRVPWRRGTVHYHSNRIGAFIMSVPEDLNSIRLSSSSDLNI